MSCSARPAATSTRRNLLSIVGPFSSMETFSLAAPWSAAGHSSRLSLDRRGGAPVLEVAQDLLDSRLHALSPVSLLQDDGREHLARPAGIIIDDNITIPIVTFTLSQGYGQAPGDRPVVVERPAAQAPLQILVAGGHDEDAGRFRIAADHLLGALDVDVEQDVDPLLQTREDLVARGAVEVVVHLRPFEEGVGGDHRLERGVIDEMVVPPVDLPLPRPAGGVAHREGQAAEVGEAAGHEALD